MKSWGFFHVQLVTLGGPLKAEACWMFSFAKMLLNLWAIMSKGVYSELFYFSLSFVILQHTEQQGCNTRGKSIFLYIHFLVSQLAGNRELFSFLVEYWLDSVNTSLFCTLPLPLQFVLLSFWWFLRIILFLCCFLPLWNCNCWKECLS